jgi:ParB family transcriptional regulator, chromosome partitioning protein
MENTPPESPKVEAPRKALGRGLAALMGDSISSSTTRTHAAQANPEPLKARGMDTVEIEKIEPNPEQPRKIFEPSKLAELAQSIKEMGVIQPIVVKKVAGDKYQIVAGERRWRASKLAGLVRIPVFVREQDAASLDHDLASLVENIQREELNPIELAIAYDRLLKTHQFTQDTLAQKLGVSRTAIANTLRLLKLPILIKNLVNERKITEGHARALLSLEGEEQMLAMAEQIQSAGLSVRDVELRVRSAIAQQAESIAALPGELNGSDMPKVKEAGILALEDELRRVFGTKVIIRGNSTRGAIEIYYAGSDSMHRVVHQLRSGIEK